MGRRAGFVDVDDAAVRSETSTLGTVGDEPRRPLRSRATQLLFSLSYGRPIAVSDSEADEVVEQCSSCGSQVLGVYVEDGRCPDCRE
ncbi:hypothetical protein DMJ13_12385 [halophilic archaeon]|nr:hypothetical protein DMJ13_12385 [halophilic archaeon]